MGEGRVPVRVQRRRTAGWRMLEGCRYVNPYRLGTATGLAREPAVLWPGQPWEYEGRSSAAGTRHDFHHPDGSITRCTVRDMTAAEVVACFEAELLGEHRWPLRPFGVRWNRLPTVDQVIAELAGLDLACWCPVWDEQGRRWPCHADVLLAVANPGWQPPATQDDEEERR